MVNIELGNLYATEMAPNLQDKSNFITQLLIYLCGINSMINYQLNSMLLKINTMETSKHLVMNSLLLQVKIVCFPT